MRKWLLILQPSADTGKTMPPLKQPVCAGTGANCTALEILDSAYPKVVMMARQGASATAMAITSTHSGTAHYTVSGLAPGNYAITLGGATIASGGVTAGDTTLSFYSTAGSILVTQNGGPAPCWIAGTYPVLAILHLFVERHRERGAESRCFRCWIDPGQLDCCQDRLVAHACDQ